MRPDGDINLAGGDVLHILGDQRFGSEAGKHGYLHGILCQTFSKHPEVLLYQKSSGSQDGNLKAGHHRFEGCADGDLGLAKSHVTTEQTLHGGGQFHVVLDLTAGSLLIRSVIVNEGFLQLFLPGPIRLVSQTGTAVAQGI